MNQNRLLRAGWLVISGFILVAATAFLEPVWLRLAIILACLSAAACWIALVISRLTERTTSLSDLTARIREETEQRRRLEDAAKQFIAGMPASPPQAASLEEYTEWYHQLSAQVNSVLEDVSLVQEDLIQITPSIAAVLNIEGPALQSHLTELSDLAKTTADRAEAIIEGIGGVAERIEHEREEARARLNSLQAAARSCLAQADKSRASLETCDKAISEWREPVNELGRAVQVATDLAEQARILGVNASIEALRSGEAGRGFVLVAEEAQRLSERMLRVAHQIAAQIEDSEKTASLAAESLANALSSLASVEEAGGYLTEEAKTNEVKEWEFPLDDASNLTKSARQLASEIGVLSGNLLQTLERLQLSTAEEARSVAEKLFGDMTEVGSRLQAFGTKLEAICEAIQRAEAQLREVENASRHLQKALG